MTQNRESGAAARLAGLAVAASIGERIGAKKLAPNSNEFEWNRQLITIRVARQKNDLVGVTHLMLKRVQAIIAAFEVSPNEYELFSISPEVFRKHMRDSKGKGKVFLVPEKIFREQGTVVTRINIITANSNLMSVQVQLENESAFDVSCIEEAKEKVSRSIVLRRGQRQFREALLKAYAGACAVTGTSIQDVLEAAHIVAYQGTSTNHVCNGLLLRSDIHALFDLGLLSIDPKTSCIYCSEQIRREVMYKELHGTKLSMPAKANQQPDSEALKNHFENKVV